MRYAIYIPPNTKDLAIKPNDGCLWKPVKRNSARASKQLRFVAITETFNGNQAYENPAISHNKRDISITYIHVH